MMLSTLGAGLQSLAGAPRLLAAIARDDLIPVLRPLVPPHGEEPRRIVLLCYVLSMSVLMLGELNAVAPFITMWFLTCYSIINGAWGPPAPAAAAAAAAADAKAAARTNGGLHN